MASGMAMESNKARDRAVRQACLEGISLSRVGMLNCIHGRKILRFYLVFYPYAYRPVESSWFPLWDRPHHGMVFAGPRNVGTLSSQTAGILALRLRQNPPSRPNPCHRG